jgi:hypothetical protein
MTTLTSTTARHAVRPAPLAAAVSAIGLAIYHVSTPGAPSASYDSVGDWIREGLFLGFLLLSVATVWGAVAVGRGPRAAAWLITVGYGAITVGVTVGAVMRDDPAWFMALGGPGILLSTAGFLTWAGWAFRRRAVPPWAALLCGVGGLVVILGAEFGASVLLAGFFLHLSFRDR